MTTEIKEYSKTEAALADLENNYANVVFDVQTKDGMKAAIVGRAEIRKYRTNLEKLRKEIKAPALQRCNAIDTEARRLTEALRALEEPIDAQIKAEEKRLEDIRMADVRAEQARLAEEDRLKREAEEQRLAQERAEIEARRKELEAMHAEIERKRLDRINAELESRRKIEEEQRAARLKIEEEQRAARMEREAEERRLRELREAQEAKERELRRAEEERERKIAQEAEEKEAEKRRIKEEAERKIQQRIDMTLDGLELLTSFVERFGELEEFRVIAKTISDFLSEQKGTP